MKERGRATNGLWPLIVVPILIVGLGIVIARFDAFKEYREYSGRQTIPESLVQSGRTGRQLRLLEYLPLDGVRLQDFDRTLQPEEMPSSTIIASQIRQSPARHACRRLHLAPRISRPTCASMPPAPQDARSRKHRPPAAPLHAPARRK